MSEAGVRLQKILAQAGFGSRRKCEELIAAGRVTVNGKRVDLGARVDPDADAIHVDGSRVVVEAPSRVTLAINKRAGVLSAMSDPEGRPTVGDMLVGREEHLFHVGRLDADSEGLLLVTSDGDLGYRLSHPRYEVPKTYVATVAGELYPRVLRALKAGVDLDDGPAAFDRVTVQQVLDGRTLVEVVLHEGRNRMVRRMFDAVDRPVERLVRTRIGPIALGQQRPGTVRVLSQVEVGSLMTAVGL